MFDETITLIFTTALLLGSPGPAPLSLAFVSSSFGVKKGLHYLYGILLGLLVVTVLTGFGLYETLKSYPKVMFFLSIFAFTYMLYIAYKIAFFESNQMSSTEPPSFKDGFILNLSNPKAYAAVFSIFSGFMLTSDNKFFSVLVTGSVFFLVGVFVDLMWVLAGASLSKFMQNKRQRQISKKACGLLLVLVLIYSLVKTII